MDAATTTDIEIFRAGQHIDMHGRTWNITRADLAAIASGYDPAKHEAPHVIGHPEIAAPAGAWVKALSVDGDSLIAKTHQIDPAFADIVNSGRYKKRSSSFLLPNSPGNPTPGQYYLNHVGWLGATPPAVKGLRDAQFAAADQCVEFASDRRWGFRDVASMFRRLRDWLIERDGADAAELVIPTWQIDSLIEAAQPDAAPAETASLPGPAFAAPHTEETTVSESQTADFAAREQQLNQQAANLQAREQAIAAREQESRRADVAAFATSLVQSGRLLPREAATVTELLLVLPADKPLSFAAGDGTTTTVQPAQALRELLTSLPKRVDYTEKSAVTAAPVASFAAPLGESVDASQLELHARASTYQSQHPGMSWLAAVKAVGG
jgi:hypothetical protein